MSMTYALPPAGSAPATRSLAIDVFRGLALIFIVVDHISGGVLQWTTLRNVALADATEVFVFLAGVVTVMAYQRIAQRSGVPMADARFWRRSAEIYRAFLVMAALMVASGYLLLRAELATPALGATEVRQFVAAPLLAIWQTITMQRQPFLSDILPMYAAFALFAPWAIRVGQRSVVALLSCSVLVWLAAPWLGSWLPSVEIPHWSFNPFAWQLVFVMGVIAGLYPQMASAGSRGQRQVLRLLAWAVVIAGLVGSLLNMHQDLRPLLLPTGWVENYPIYSKTDAAWPRLVNFVALAWLVHDAIRRWGGDSLWQALSPVARVGRHGLVCFVGGAVISIGAEALSYTLSGGTPRWPQALLSDIVAVAAILALALVWERGRAFLRTVRTSVTPTGVSRP